MFFVLFLSIQNTGRTSKYKDLLLGLLNLASSLGHGIGRSRLTSGFGSLKSLSSDKSSSDSSSDSPFFSSSFASAAASPAAAGAAPPPPPPVPTPAPMLVTMDLRSKPPAALAKRPGQ